MQIQAPEGKQVVVAQGDKVDAAISVDVDAGTYIVNYGPRGTGPGARKSSRGPLPADLQKALQALILSTIEKAEEWTAGTSKLVLPPEPPAPAEPTPATEAPKPKK